MLPSTKPVSSEPAMYLVSTLSVRARPPPDPTYPRPTNRLDPSRSHGTYIMSPQPAEFGWRFLSGRVEGRGKKRGAPHSIAAWIQLAGLDFADVPTRTAAAKFWGCVLFSPLSGGVGPSIRGRVCCVCVTSDDVPAVVVLVKWELFALCLCC